MPNDPAIELAGVAAIGSVLPRLQGVAPRHRSFSENFGLSALTFVNFAPLGLTFEVERTRR